MKTNCIALLLFMYFPAANTLEGKMMENQIVGKWMSTQGNITVQIFKDHDEFKAKVVWFDDSDDRTKPMNTRTDTQNPDPGLRSRKIIGMEVLRNLKFNANTNRWEGGIIYDAKSGKEWSSSGFLTQDGMLQVKGFWHFEFIGRTMTFRRIN